MRQSPNTQVVRSAASSATLVSTVYSGSGGLTPAQTAEAVWGADPDSYKTSGTFGEWFRKIFWGGKKNI